MTRSWPLLSLPVIVVAICIGFAPLLHDLQAQWNDAYGAMSHGYLVFALAGYLAVRAWRSGGGPPAARPWWLAAIPLVALLGVAWWLESRQIGTGRAIVLPPLLLAVLSLAFGPAVLQRLAWPVAFCYFGLPVWYPFNSLLQWATTTVSTAIVHLTGVPVYVEGNFVHITAGVFEIASGCAGLNYFIVALTIGAFAATLYLHRWSSRLTLFVATAVAGIVANWARVSSLILIGHATRMQHYLVRVDHLVYGWVLFLVMMVPVALLLRRLQDREAAGNTAAIDPLDVPATASPVAAGGGWYSAVALLVGCLAVLLPAALRGSN